jgi:cell shape-determining protein MreD
MQERLQILAETWIGYKTRLVEVVGLTNDAMHVHGSILILFVSAIILRRRPDSIWCWLIVFAAELFNEYADLKGVAPGEATMDAAVHDLYNTMLWPTVILILGRFLFPPRKKELRKETETSGDLADQSFEQPATV